MSEIPDWLPDWTDETSYDFPGPKDFNGWAWEFLRRNPKYQKAWQENYVDGPLTWYQEMVDASSDDDARRIYENNIDRFDCQVCDPPALPGETKSKYLSRVGECTLTTLGVHLARRFGLSSGQLLSPSDRPRIDKISFESSGGPHHLDWGAYAERDQMIGMKPESPEQVVVRFDLEWPLKMQWQRILKSLEYKQKHLVEREKITLQSPRINVSNYPLHLRLLDADSHGESTSDMASVLYPSDYSTDNYDKVTQTVRNKLTAAKRMRDGGYIFLGFKY